jgi:hypothetical protein
MGVKHFHIGQNTNREFETTVPRTTGIKRGEITEDWKNCTMRSFMICLPRRILLGYSDQEG